MNQRFESNPYRQYPGSPVLYDAATAINAGIVERSPKGHFWYRENGRVDRIDQENYFDLVTPTLAKLDEITHPRGEISSLIQQARELWYSKSEELAYGVFVIRDQIQSKLPTLSHYPDRHITRLAHMVSNQTLLREYGFQGTFLELIEQTKHIVPGVAGSSVGSEIFNRTNLVFRPQQSKLADPKPGNLTGANRAPYTEYEMIFDSSKAVSIARRMHDHDPFMQISVYDHGITSENKSDFISGNLKIQEPPSTVIFDEIDDVTFKIPLRQACRDQRTPLVMITDVGMNSLVEFRRFDKYPDLPLVYGISDEHINNIQSEAEQGNPESKMQLILALVGKQNIRGEMLRILAPQGGDIPVAINFAQDGATAAYGGVLAPRLIGKIANNQPMPERMLFEPFSGMINSEGEIL